MKKIYYYLALLQAFLIHLAFAPLLSAQVKDITVYLSDWEMVLKSISDHIVDICLIIVGLIGMVMAIPNAVKHFKGDPSSSDAFLKLGGGLILGVLIIQLCRILIA